ncbi:MAG: hypothetical protein H6Q90_5511, partial [Deltaproteobacteria bacterium]|nr:hypothetical protein [Deltaproteobacteria bacterium]
MKIKTLALVFAFAIPALASADDKQADKSTPSDKSTTDKSKTDKSAAKLGEAEIKLVAHIHHVNTMVIDLGKLAERSGTAAVKR